MWSCICNPLYAFPTPMITILLPFLFGSCSGPGLSKLAPQFCSLLLSFSSILLNESTKAYVSYVLVIAF
jgi:hypothetical protein